MQLLLTDFNGADNLCQTTYATEWGEVQSVLSAMPPHIQDSDQAGKQGTLIFDPKGTNREIKQGLDAAGWRAQRIPSAWSMFGKDVDFAKPGVIVEVQFSNYPFVANNLMRTELLNREQVGLPDRPPELLVIITKFKLFDASNSTLYYEQARDQLNALHVQSMFSMPVRLVGLGVAHGSLSCVYTNYSSKRYSRSVTTSSTIECDFEPGARAESRAKFTRLP